MSIWFCSNSYSKSLSSISFSASRTFTVDLNVGFVAGVVLGVVTDPDMLGGGVVGAILLGNLLPV